MLQIGHRAAAGYATENSAQAIKKALELRVNMIEIDVRKCATGELVIFHDKKIDRLTTGSGLISELSLSELKSIATPDGQKILTLAEALALIRGRSLVNLHLKTKNIVRPLMQIISDAITGKDWSIRHFLISSFNAKDLKKIKKIDKRIRVGLLYYRNILSIVRRARKLSAYSVHLHRRLLQKKLIDKLKKYGIKTFIWTLNNDEDIDRARALKVDGVISDFPDRV
ncbi:MAG: glycerophosphodiester phosphodiesterase family protein [Candidatus Magasanikbacteria bacterium]